MLHPRRFAAALGLVSLCATAGVGEARAADVLWQSAAFTGIGQAQGFALDADQYLGARFYNGSRWRVAEVGGHVFQAAAGADGLFVALVPLTSEQALPSDADLAQPYWVATFEAPLLSDDVLVPCGVILEPGWWGVVFGGGGLHGSTRSGGLAANQRDVGDPSWFRRRDGAWEDSGSDGKRMFLTGTEVCVEDTGDTASQCAEDCANGLDDDADGWTDCQDEDCWILPTCCDADLDGYARRDQVCGWGPDCDDHPETGPAIRPGQGEVIADGVDQDCDGADACWADADGDGYGSARRTVIGVGLVCGDDPGEAAAPDDCDDSSPIAAAVHPGAPETVGDGVDMDCDGVELCWVDADSDGWGGPATALAPGMDCLAGPQLAFVGGDCDDEGPDAAAFYPGAPDAPHDGVDQDCDGVDACWLDADGDGYGGHVVVPGWDLTCTPGRGVSDRDDDCADAGPGAEARHPDAFEVIDDGVDQDCDGLDACYRDADRDGYGTSEVVPAAPGTCTSPGLAGIDGDCRDAGPGAGAVNPAAVEVVGDGVDQDCNGVDDCWRDQDGDGVGGPVVARGDGLLCPTDAGLTAVGGDCQDAGPGARRVYPGAPEVVGDGVDQDCDGDDLCWRDEDGDAFGGDVAVPAGGTCGDDPAEATDGGDCDDFDAERHPTRPEVAGDGVDQDCDGLDGCFADRDGDGVGADPVAAASCADPGFAPTGGDCDDGEPREVPGGVEVPYDGLDNDCLDGDRVDRDGDGFAWVGAGGLDCDDGRPDVAPGADEVIPGVDDDCDGLVDEGTLVFDDDGDGFAEIGGDCDDGERRRHPAAVERCDGVDEDCDGVVDDGTLCFDDDGDGLSEIEGDCNDADRAVRPGAVDHWADGVDQDCDGVGAGDSEDPDGDGVTEAAGDCAPDDPSVRPGLPELPDGVDQDCDGVVDEGTDREDRDGDGYSGWLGDCDDTDPTTNPDAPEIYGNGRDDDCDGVVDGNSDITDVDGDGWPSRFDCDDGDPRRNPQRPEVRNALDDDCDGEIDEDIDDEDGDGWRLASGDCDDRQGWVHPGAAEVCDGLDNDCDGRTDEGCGPVGEARATGACAVGGGHLALSWLFVLVAMRRRVR